MTKIVLAEITDLQAETINGGSVASDLKNFYFGNIKNLQINERDGVINIFNFNFGRKRDRH